MVQRNRLRKPVIKDSFNLETEFLPKTESKLNEPKNRLLLKKAPDLTIEHSLEFFMQQTIAIKNDMNPQSEQN